MIPRKCIKPDLLTLPIATLDSSISLQHVNEELSRVEARLQQLRWANDPELWAQEKLGDVLWSGQRKILQAVRDHRKTAAATCHEVSKSFSAGLLAAWWIDTHKLGDAYVITTAPTQPQVRIILWKEIARAHSRGNLVGRVNQTEWMAKVGNKEESVAIGRKPSDYSPSSFTGKHAPFVLAIVDEANGVRGPLWESIYSLIANDQSKLVMFGNPDDPSGEFFEACKPGSGFKVLHLSAFDSPNFTGEEFPLHIKQQLIGPIYVEEKRAKWAPSWYWVNKNGQRVEPIVIGERAPQDGVKVVPPSDGKLEDTHPFWQSKVLGQFPIQSANGSLIPLSWIRAAQQRTLDPVGVNELGLDVGASRDGDPSCLGHRRGPVFRVLYEERQPDTMKTTGKLLQHLSDERYGATLAKVDYIGVGRGVVDRSREQNLPVYPISVSEASTITRCLVCKHEWDQIAIPQSECPKCGNDHTQKVFPNFLSQIWWNIRSIFEKGQIDLDEKDEDLAEQLLTLLWEPNSKGQIVVKYSDGPSPNRADALLMTFAPIVKKAQDDFVSW